jgi:hypothetical protein
VEARNTRRAARRLVVAGSVFAAFLWRWCCCSCSRLRLRRTTHPSTRGRYRRRLRWTPQAESIRSSAGWCRSWRAARRRFTARLSRTGRRRQRSGHGGGRSSASSVRGGPTASRTSGRWTFHPLSAPRFISSSSSTARPGAAGGRTLSPGRFRPGARVRALKGIRSEVKADCFGMQSLDQAVVVLGRSRAEGRYLAAMYWTHWYQWHGPEIRSPECREGGRLDRSPSHVWP